MSFEPAQSAAPLPAELARVLAEFVLPRLGASYDDAARADDNARLLLQTWYSFAKALAPGDVARLFQTANAAAKTQLAAVKKAVREQ